MRRTKPRPLASHFTPCTSLTRIHNRNGPFAGSSNRTTASRSAHACGVRCCLACGQGSTLTCRAMAPLASGWSAQARTSHLPNATDTKGAHNDDSRTNQQHEITTRCNRRHQRQCLRTTERRTRMACRSRRNLRRGLGYFRTETRFQHHRVSCTSGRSSSKGQPGGRHTRIPSSSETLLQLSQQ